MPNTRLPWGLRTVDGSYNNLVPGQEQFGAADQDFPMLMDQVFRNDRTATASTFGPVALSPTPTTPRPPTWWTPTRASSPT
jgi:hypothetical protein